MLLIAVNEACASFSPPPTSSLFSSSAAVPLQTTTTAQALLRRAISVLTLIQTNHDTHMLALAW